MFLCSIVVTSEYIIETTQQLEGKLKEKVDPDFSGRISFGGEQNVYHGVITSCIQMLVQELETACEPPLSQVRSLTQFYSFGLFAIKDHSFLQTHYITKVRISC